MTDCIYIKIIDDPLSRRKTAIVDSAVFSIDITNDNQLLLDTCGGESVFRTATLFYDIVPADTPMIVNGVNSRGEPMVIREYGTTDF